MKVNGKTFIVFYVVIGTLSHAKLIMESLLQNDKAKAFSEGGRSPPQPPSSQGGDPLDPLPLMLIKNEGEGIFLEL